MYKIKPIHLTILFIKIPNRINFKRIENSKFIEMKDVITYKGFIGSVHYSAEDEVFYGKIEGVNDLVTFEGKSVEELKTSFEYVVNEHIKDCEEQELPLEKSYKGNFN